MCSEQTLLKCAKNHANWFKHFEEDSSQMQWLRVSFASPVCNILLAVLAEMNCVWQTTAWLLLYIAAWLLIIQSFYFDF